MNAVTSNFHRPVDAPPHVTYEALMRLRSCTEVPDALAALGLEEHAVPLHWTGLSGAVAFRLVWRLSDGGRAEMTWTIAVGTDGHEGSLLSVEANTASTNGPLPPLVRVADLHARRILAIVSSLAEELAEEDAAHTLVPLPVAV